MDYQTLSNDRRTNDYDYNRILGGKVGVLEANFTQL